MRIGIEVILKDFCPVFHFDQFQYIASNTFGKNDLNSKL